MRTYTIDGDQFSTLEQFAEHFSDRVLAGGYRWTGNLDALNDILRGGFGTPLDGFLLVWRESDQSRVLLGYGETVRQLELRLQRCDLSNRPAVELELGSAKRAEGKNVFDWLVAIIRAHGPGGDESGDNVVLELQ